MRSVISIKLQSNFILRHRCTPVNLLHIFRTLFPRNTSGWLLLLISVPLLSSIYTCNHNGLLRHDVICNITCNISMYGIKD